MAVVADYLWAAALAQADLVDKEVDGMMNYILFGVDDVDCHAANAARNDGSQDSSLRGGAADVATQTGIAMK